MGNWSRAFNWNIRNTSPLHPLGCTTTFNLFTHTINWSEWRIIKLTFLNCTRAQQLASRWVSAVTMWLNKFNAACHGYFQIDYSSITAHKSNLISLLFSLNNHLSLSLSLPLRVYEYLSTVFTISTPFFDEFHSFHSYGTCQSHMNSQFAFVGTRLTLVDPRRSRHSHPKPLSSFANAIGQFPAHSLSPRRVMVYNLLAESSQKFRKKGLMKSKWKDEWLKRKTRRALKISINN